MVLDILSKRGMVIDWSDYVKSSLDSGCNPDTIRHRVESAVGDCFGSKYREEVSERLKGNFLEEA